ncbi:hypothetical protein GF380_03815 [Candidatus Uhrbacteria bacterium]|nr:hypothetical protein [Candidatus Uhrbacteria bacterium]MBD3284220.1 hypothetical protein [Candidatus Uhrbacteria bacterium]
MPSVSQQPSVLTHITEQIERAAEVLEQECDEMKQIERIRPIWVDAMCILIGLQCDSPEAKHRADRLFRIKPYAVQNEEAGRINFAIDRFIQIARASLGHLRSSMRPPPLSSHPAPAIPQQPNAPGTDALSVILDRSKKHVRTGS